MYLYILSLALTFTGLHAFKPSVVNVSVADSLTVLKPSAARSATADSARFLECAALWARHHVSDR